MAPKKKVAILQSNYIPWKGYFDLINMADEFIFYDEVQFTKNDWRNRNKIKTHTGIQWLTIPVRQESLSQKIKDTQITDIYWNKKHWNAISINYSKAKYFKEYKDIFEELYRKSDEKYLCEVNYKFIKLICNILGINTQINWSSNYQLIEGKTERLVSICKQAGASHYVAGPSSKNYLDERLFKHEEISIEYIDYTNYPEYNQLHGQFVHEVSVIDLILNEGPNAPRFMKSFNVFVR